MYESLFTTESYETTTYRDSILNIIKNHEKLTVTIPSEKYIIFGTDTGKIHLINHLGYLHHTFYLFKDPIKHICVDVSCDFMATISNTSKVFVLDILSKDICFSVDFSKTITAVAICPQIAKSSPKSIAFSSNQRIILYQKYWLNDKKINIHVSDSPINFMCWYDKFLSWTNNSGAGVYNMETRQWISHIPFKEDIISKSMQLSYCIHWINNEQFLVSYGSSIKYCTIKQREITKQQMLEPTKTLPLNFVEITCIGKLDGNNILGVGYIDSYVICITEECPRDMPPLETDIVVNESTDKEYESASTGCIIIKSLTPCNNEKKQLKTIGYDRISFPNDTKDSITVGHSSKEKFLVVAVGKTILFSKPKTCDQILEWLFENELYKRALDYAIKNSKKITNYTIDDIQKKFLFHNLNHNNFQLISENIDVIPSNDSDTWEVVINHFINKKYLHLLSQKLPSYQQCPLKIETYNKILHYYIDNISSDHSNISYLNDFITRFHEYEGFDMNSLCMLVERTRNIYSNDINKNCYLEISQLLATIYIFSMRYTDALDIYLNINSKECLSLLENHIDCIDHNYIIQHLSLLFDIDFSKFSDIIIHNNSYIPIGHVVDTLSLCNKPLLLSFLKRLHYDGSNLLDPFMDTLIELFIEFKEENLLHLLKHSSNFDIIKATKLCEKNDLYYELVYLYEILGNYVMALELVTDKLQNLEMAIDICKRVEDDDLWNILLNYCVKSPQKIKILIENIGFSLNIVKLLNKIPSGFTIPKLNESLRKIMTDYSIRLELNQLCCQIMKNENIGSFSNYYSKINQGIAINKNQICCICNCLICFNDVNCVDKCTIFYCGHCYHYDCLKHTSLTSDFTDFKVTCPECLLASTILDTQI